MLKLAVAVAAAEAPPSAFVVWRGFEESIAKAADLGYHGVELALKTAGDVDADRLSRWLLAQKMEVSCISTGQVFASLGLYFTHPDPEAQKHLIRVFGGLIHLAKDFGKMINVGRARGFIGENETREETEKRFVEVARRICDRAAENGVTIVIEPVNRYEINFVNNLDEGATLLAKVERENLGLMPDVFHMNIEDAHIGESLAAYASLIRYVHLADSNRLAPGWGHLDFADVFDGLRRAAYGGWASIEILAKPDPDRAARKASQTVLPWIEEYNRSLQKRG